jgi:outer membrane protein TolC
MRLLWIFWVAAGSLVAASPGGVRYDAHTFVERVMGSAYTARYSELALQKASAAYQKRTLWPNPELELEFGSSPDGQEGRYIALSQKLPAWGSGALRAGDRHRVEQAQAHHEAIEHQLIIDALALYVTLYFNQEAIGILDDEIARAEGLLAIAKARVDSGEIALAAKTRIAIAKEQLVLDRAEYEQRAIALQKQAQLLLGSDRPIVVAELPPKRTPLSESPPLTALPDLRAARAQRAHHEARLRLQMSRRLPSLALTLFQERVSGGDKEEETAGFGMGLVLPLWDQNRLSIEEARIDRRVAEVREEEVARSKALEIAQTRLLYEQSLKQSRRFQKSMEEVRLYYDAQEQMFESGESTLMALLDAHAFFLDRRLRVNQLRAESFERYLDWCGQAFVHPLKEIR